MLAAAGAGNIPGPLSAAATCPPRRLLSSRLVLPIVRRDLSSARRGGSVSVLRAIRPAGCVPDCGLHRAKAANILILLHAASDRSSDADPPDRWRLPREIPRAGALPASRRAARAWCTHSTIPRPSDFGRRRGAGLGIGSPISASSLTGDVVWLRTFRPSAIFFILIPQLSAGNVLQSLGKSPAEDQRRAKQHQHRDPKSDDRQFGWQVHDQNPPRKRPGIAPGPSPAIGRRALK